MVPIQLDPSLLQDLIAAGPSRIGDVGDVGKVDAVDHKERGLEQENEPVRFGFQPQRRYVLEGRIIHKRKLSRKLFFLDLVFVHKKRPYADSAAGDQDVSGLWEDIDPSSGSSGNNEPNLCRTRSTTRLEVIVRFPTHSLKDLDNLWCRVHLGAVVRAVGDIELSEKKRVSGEEGVKLNHEGDKPDEWSALLHCLEFETLELWTGKEAFEPHPGSAEINNERGRQGEQNGSQAKLNNKRKSADMLGSTTADVQRGDEAQPHCKFWLNTGKCNKNPCPFWHETDLAKLKAERKRWVEERIQAKRQISHHSSDPHQKTTKNQHRERALYFAQWLIQTFTRDYLNSGAGVLDIAGGRGDLSWELQTRQGIQSTIVEPRQGKGMRKWQRKWLAGFLAANQGPAADAETTEATADNSKAGDEADEEEEDKDRENEDQEPAGLADFIPTVKSHPLQATDPDRIQTILDDEFLEKRHQLVRDSSILIGLHPDQATEPIVRAALKAGKPFAIIPCCVFSRENTHRVLPNTKTDKSIEPEGSTNGTETATDTRPVSSYDDFVTWLASLHPEIETTWLNFEGMNRVLFWRGPSE
ncbi:hypothetical protein EMPS_02013 [Entomortierella parvispora]|uniref:C3H1-type domain-containing protein n=1 Tax=Entomortierella parvispora TaxID=205924 RepID=A0A9P3H459_9FUNG|nr:hypothetical protein EMPS_02013 [Entomortierella parvispora]